jgi:glutathione S-transferase
MITLYDYLPSQNAYKVRLLLSQLQRPYLTEIISIFEGEGQRPEYLAINPTGAVPAIKLDDGRVLAESNAILVFLAEGTPTCRRTASPGPRCCNGCPSRAIMSSPPSRRCGTGS